MTQFGPDCWQLVDPLLNLVVVGSVGVGIAVGVQADGVGATAWYRWNCLLLSWSDLSELEQLSGSKLSVLEQRLGTVAAVCFGVVGADSVLSVGRGGVGGIRVGKVVGIRATAWWSCRRRRCSEQWLCTVGAVGVGVGAVTSALELTWSELSVF